MTGSRILVVEDESIFDLDLLMRLKRMGHSEVTMAATGQAALTWALTNRPGFPQHYFPGAAVS